MAELLHAHSSLKWEWMWWKPTSTCLQIDGTIPADACKAFSAQPGTLLLCRSVCYSIPVLGNVPKVFQLGYKHTYLCWVVIWCYSLDFIDGGCDSHPRTCPCHRWSGSLVHHIAQCSLSLLSLCSTPGAGIRKTMSPWPAHTTSGIYSRPLWPLGIWKWNKVGTGPSPESSLSSLGAFFIENVILNWRVMHFCNLSSQGPEAGGWWVRGQPGICNKLEANLSYAVATFRDRCFNQLSHGARGNLSKKKKRCIKLYINLICFLFLNRDSFPGRGWRKVDGWELCYSQTGAGNSGVLLQHRRETADKDSILCIS